MPGCDDIAVGLGIGLGLLLVVVVCGINIYQRTFYDAFEEQYYKAML